MLVNFSISKQTVDFIHDQRNGSLRNPVLRFAQRELLTRIVGVSLSVFALIDFSVHGLCALGIAFYAGAKGLVTHKPVDLSSSIQHLKCMKVFAEYVVLASLIGITNPSFGFGLLENDRIKNVIGLLLSRDEKYYTKDSHLNELSFLKYIRSLAKTMPDGEKAEMAETLALLEGAEETLRMQNRLKVQSIFLDSRLAPMLTKKIEKLCTQNRTLFERIFYKECLARLLAAGLSIFAAVDLAYRVVLLTAVLVETVVLDPLLGGRFFEKDPKEMGLFLLNHLRDIFITFAGVITGSIVGMIAPEIGSKLANPGSDLYDKIRLSHRVINAKKLDDLERLEVGKSLLIPAAFRVDMGGGHITYCLIKKEAEGTYRVNVINKGWGSGVTISGVGSSLGQTKYPINFRSKTLDLESAKKYLQGVLELDHSWGKVIKKAKKEGVKTKNAILQKLYGLERHGIFMTGGVLGSPSQEKVLKANLQKTGDCPKASLLGAMYYHSAESHSVFGVLDQKPYKRFMTRLKERALKQDGHLLNIALSTPSGAYKAARQRVMKRSAQGV